MLSVLNNISLENLSHFADDIFEPPRESVGRSLLQSTKSNYHFYISLVSICHFSYHLMHPHPPIQGAQNVFMYMIRFRLFAEPNYSLIMYFSSDIIAMNSGHYSWYIYNWIEVPYYSRDIFQVE